MKRRLRASSIRTLSVVFFVAALAVTAILYGIAGCGNDWFVIAGLFVDGVGAGLLAAPDLAFFRSITYSGTVRVVLDELSGTKNMWVPTEPDWYEVFLNEMKEVLSTEEIPETAEFRIERDKNSNLLWYMPDPGKEDETAINLFNVFTPFRETIEKEEKRIRRYGVGLFIGGIILQIGGLLFSNNPFPAFFC